MQENEPIQLGLNQPQPTVPPPLADDLQFQKAEFQDGGRRCVLCQAPIADSYYHYAGKVVCPACAAQRAELQKPTAPIHFGRALLYGLGGAAAGSAIYAIVSMTTGFQLSLISILVGLIVGKSIKRATGGRGGMKFQVLAVLLTYGAITTSYIPEIVRGARTQANLQKTQQQNPPPQTAPRPTLKNLAWAIIFLVGICLIAPFLYLFNSPGGGLLNAVILFFGLMQAWRQTAGDNAVLMGPYRADQS